MPTAKLHRSVGPVGMVVNGPYMHPSWGRHEACRLQRQGRDRSSLSSPLWDLLDLCTAPGQSSILQTTQASPGEASFPRTSGRDPRGRVSGNPGEQAVGKHRLQGEDTGHLWAPELPPPRCDSLLPCKAPGVKGEESFC